MNVAGEKYRQQKGRQQKGRQEEERYPQESQEERPYEERSESKNEKMRTEYIHRDDMVCFTIEPVKTCVSGKKPTQTKQVEVDFHCLPKESPFTQQLINEAQKHVVKRIANKRVDLRQTLTVPVSCTA